ncbi:hypothetical protein NEPTK9_000183 [Candidatus Neptunochlamydia vexilliferae]|uniref:Uncharacterized protein n=1 Tax=Candidatus Neptunichlamydia vexilliferae TaxID=1651774 RepID=A0ABS0AX18_9BACT|nr:hypothetical protein [Candidatus Neptunochlamydia vexilliferae]
MAFLRLRLRSHVRSLERFFLENLAHLLPSSKSPFFSFLATYHIRFGLTFSLTKKNTEPTQLQSRRRRKAAS